MTDEFIQGLLRDALKRIDAIAEQIYELDRKIVEDNLKCIEMFQEHLKPLREKVEVHTETLTKHEQIFGTIGFLLTGGVAALAGAWQWIGKFFGHQ